MTTISKCTSRSLNRQQQENDMDLPVDILSRITKRIGSTPVIPSDRHDPNEESDLKFQFYVNPQEGQTVKPVHRK
jgi:hypothetical protein